jgi:Spy/CpxP family protein refolding chaperone
MLKKILCPLALLLCASTLFTQTTPPAANPQGQTGGPRRGNFTPCWQQAGIEKSVMEQRWSIERDTRSQVEAVCSNSSLTPQQKQQQARELHQQARQKMEGLITAEQEKALTACQQQHAGSNNHPGGGGMHGEGGGCGEWPHTGQRPSGSPNGAPGSSNGGNSTPPPAGSSPSPN